MQNKKVQYKIKWKIMNFKKVRIKNRTCYYFECFMTQKMRDKAFNKSFLAFSYIPD